ncbi:hypothetical protein [Adhaeribacter soli]|uniref:DUF4377 domain-containing protein n=1 Tax=Adhaeribacter soli TaxID=2607655 RepID=A0A5N1IL65_9BACT|nr:hypothetical protein [Adhaeribacter soli]KAA9325946.1 hypothetical protein F0P94_16100 [Adhaeribacter soli]
MIRLILMVLLPFLFSKNAVGQNLVYNGSFEENSKQSGCCNDYGMIEDASGWFRLTGSADLFNACCQAGNMQNVPKNFSGFQYPHDGNAYAGLFLLMKDKRYEDFYYREYIHTKLLQRLQKGIKYKVSFYLSLGECSKLFSDHISVCFAPEKKLFMEKVPHHLLKGINVVKYNLNPSIAKDSVNWNKIEIEYEAKGGEEYLVIGSFSDDISKGQFKAILKRNLIYPAKDKSESKKYAYYFIDNVSVVSVKQSGSSTLESSKDSK